MGESAPSRSPFFSFKDAQALLASSSERLENSCTCTLEPLTGFPGWAGLAAVAGAAGIFACATCDAGADLVAGAAAVADDFVGGVSGDRDGVAAEGFVASGVPGAGGGASTAAGPELSGASAVSGTGADPV